MPTLVEELHRTEMPPLATLTVDDYRRMNDSGALREGAAVELLDGLLVRKDRRDAEGAPMSHGPRHALLIGMLQDVLESLVRPHGFHVRTQLPVTLPPSSEPEPDLAVVQGSRLDYPRRHPEPADVPLVVEIAGSSLAHDRRTKARLYAAAGISIYWIVNLEANVIEVHTQPATAVGRYERVETIRRGGLLQLALGLAPVELPVASLLPE